MKQKITTKNNPFINIINKVTGYGMTPNHYADFKSRITGLEKKYGKRLRVYFTGERTTLKWYMNKYFHSYYHDIDDDAGRVVFICDNEETRDNLYNILHSIKTDVDYDIPDGDGGSGDGGSGDDELYIIDEGNKKNSNNTYIIIGIIAIAVITIIVVKKKK